MSPVFSSLCRYFERKRFLASALVASSASLGVLTIPPLVQVIIQEYSLVGAMVFLGGQLLQACIVAVILLPMAPKPEMEVICNKVDRVTGHASLLRKYNVTKTGDVCSTKSGITARCWNVSRELTFLQNASLIRVWLCVTVCSMAYMSFFVFIPPYGLEIGLNDAQISLIFIIMGITECVTRPVIGSFMNRYNLDETLVLLLACIVAALVCVGLGFLHTFWCLCLLSTILATTGGLFFSLMIPLVANVVKEADLGRALGGLPLAIGLGYAAGGPLFG